MYLTKNATAFLAQETKPKPVYQGEFFIINELSEDFVDRRSLDFSKIVDHVQRIYKESGLTIQVKELDKTNGENPKWQKHKNRVSAGNLVEAYVRVLESDGTHSANPGITTWFGHPKKIILTNCKVDATRAMTLSYNPKDKPIENEYRIAYAVAHEGLHQYFNWADNDIGNQYLLKETWFDDEGHYLLEKKAHLNMSGPKLISVTGSYPASTKSNERHDYERILDFMVEVIRLFSKKVR